MAGVMMEYITVIVVALFAVSEALALIPAVRSNGVFDFVQNVLKALVGKLKK
jgi:hypothetical protein